MWINYTTFIESFNFHAKTVSTVNVILYCFIDIGWRLRFRHFCRTICNETVSSHCNRKSLKACVTKIATRFEIFTTISSLYFFGLKKPAKIVSYIKLDRIQPFKLLKTRYKLITRSHVEAVVGDKFVFQFLNRCKLPTCAIGYHTRYCWRRFSAGWIRSAWCVYVLCTALRKFSLNRVSFEHFFSIFVIKINILSIKLFFKVINATIISFKMTRKYSNYNVCVKFVRLLICSVVLLLTWLSVRL